MVVCYGSPRKLLRAPSDTSDTLNSWPLSNTITGEEFLRIIYSGLLSLRHLPTTAGAPVVTAPAAASNSAQRPRCTGGLGLRG